MLVSSVPIHLEKSALFYLGKTTLMNVLSGHCADSLLTTTGDIYLNGCLTTSTQRMTSGLIGYVEQNEIFIDTMTLEEHLIFQVICSFGADQYFLQSF